MSNPNYRDMWMAGASEKAPKASIIGGLQKLLTQKEDDIIALSAQLNGLKQRMAEYTDIMEQMEQKFVAQQNRINELESGSGGRQAYTPVSSFSGEGSAEDRKTIERLTHQLRDMENKLYIFSNLPSRITELEAKIQKQQQTIDDYDEAQEKLKATIRKLSTEGGADKVIAELQEKVKAQEKQIQQIQSGKNTMPAIDFDAPGGSMEAQLRQQILYLNNEKNQMTSQIQQISAKLETAHKTIQSLQMSQASAPSTGVPDVQLRQDLANLKMERDRLQSQVNQMSEQLKIAGNAASGGPTAMEAELRTKNAALSREVEDLKEKIRAEQMKIEDIVAKAQKGTAAAPSSNELIETLNIKINSLTAQNKKLQDEIKQLGGTAAPPGLKPIAAPSLTPSAPKIRAIDSGISKDKEMELNQQINELRKQVAEKDAQLSQTSKDLIETQTQIAQIKAAGPQDSSSGNMMNLMQDLQMKIKKLKDQLRMKDEEIATLKQK